jgi:hypothetical protein
MAMLGEHREVLLDPRRERLGGVAVVVEVELDLAIAAADKVPQLVEEMRSILLTGKEPTVPWWAPVAVAKLAE